MRATRPGWVAQVCHVQVDGKRLTIRTEPGATAMDGRPSTATLIWEKVEP